MKLPAYPKYKPSLSAGPSAKAGGVDWLGAVPEHWGLKRGRFVMRVNPSSPRLRALKAAGDVGENA